MGHPEPDQQNTSEGDETAPVELTEDALAEIFTHQHAQDWRYVAAWGQWLTWTGRVWVREDTLKAYDLSRKVCRAAQGAQHPTQDQAVIGFDNRCRRAHRPRRPAPCRDDRGLGPRSLGAQHAGRRRGSAYRPGRRP
uniref:Bacteriophage/plasmid primase P4 C-terminal domain-containing protein n=1 Tax=Phenylobacterium glaciei TaxID=2803784 RepID=A0A974P4L7_9CAUL|nr:hypothetical protein JKL49_00745 [Phenylobacterium glaciei]